MKRFILNISIALALGLGLTLALLWMLDGGTTPVTAAPAGRPLQGPGDVYCVAPVSQTYVGCTRVFTSVQFAVDAATGGEIVKVAAGTYTDIHQRSGVTQVVRIGMPLTIRGGYTTASNFAGPPDPKANPTTLDAGGQGRVVYIASVTATLEGLRLTNGSTSDSGGGIYAAFAHPVIKDCQIYSNTASSGGGVGLTGSDNAILTGNEIYSNTASSMHGGGVVCSVSNDAALSGNQIYSNTANVYGGGAFLNGSDRVTLTGNVFHNNTAGDSGGGVFLFSGCDAATLINNVIVDNQVGASGHGGAVHVAGSEASLLHTTIARNHGGDGSGVYVDSYSYPGSVALTNTILVSQTVGVFVTSNGTNTATLESTLWGDGPWANGDDWDGPGAITSTNNYTGNPAFVDYTGGDYHITSASAAWDLGVDAGVYDDIDGDSRPFGAKPDLGADEVSCLVRLNGVLYDTVQAGVDASSFSTDTVQVAGTCRGVETRASSDQVAYISKTLTLRGGYSPDFSAWDPELYPTTLDAQGQGRVIYLAGQVLDYITPTLEGLRLANGYSGGGSGGGVNGWWASAIISGCQVHDSYAHQSGGGIYIMYGANARLTNNRIYSNTVGFSTYYGGGISLNNGDGTVFANNEVIGNQAPRGGGVAIYNSDLTMTNNVIADNQASTEGSGLHILNCSPHLLHTTIARNSGGDGSGIYVTRSGGSAYSSVALTNTILVSHTIGITVTDGNTATLEATLWGDGDWANVTDIVGSNIVTGTLNWWGDPAFIDYEGGDYHLGAGSAAFERGISTGVSHDIDGDPRSVGLAPDLGADEGLPELALTKWGPAWLNQGQHYTYTLTITNTGAATATNVVLTDAVPSLAQFLWASDNGTVTVSSVVTWPAFIVAPGGGVVTRTFAVKASSAITNSDYRATAQGMPSVVGTVVVTNQLNTTQADAGTNQSLHSGVVTLDGSSSYDPEGHYPLEYEWWQSGGPTTVTLHSANTAVATFTAPSVAGSYWLRLRITDALGATDTDLTMVNVTNTDPVADAGAAQSVAPDTTITLDGSGSYDPDGDALTYGWEQTGGPPITLSSYTAVSPTFTSPITSSVTLTFTLTVTDTFNTAHSAVTTVTVKHYVYLPLALRNY